MNDLIKKFNIRRKKYLWQNFLVNDDILEKISSFCVINNENILEIWPWYWALTKYILWKKPKSLTLIEFDLDMVKILNDLVLKKELNIENVIFSVENVDVLRYEIPDFSYKVIANIPYYITSPIITKFLYDKNPPKEMIILMQKEVWLKIISEKSSVLSLSVLKKREPYLKLKVSKTNFLPQPKVDSVVIYFKKHSKYEEIDDVIFLSFIKKAFSNPRKKLMSNLKNSFLKEKVEKVFLDLKINENIRPEDLSILEYIELIKKIVLN